MGRNGSGVTVYATGVRIRLSVGGVKVNEVVRINGKVAAPTGANQKYAARLATEIRRKLTEGTYHHADYFPLSAQATTGIGATVADALDAWLKTQIDITSSTRRGYTSVIDSLWKPGIGAKVLSSLRKSDILLALAKRPRLSGKSRNNAMSILRGALALAVEDGAIAKNPADEIEAFKHQRPPVDPFDADERGAILAHLAEHSHPQVHNYFDFAFWTGLRTSENIGLSWPSVDLRKRQLLVHEGYVRGEMVASTKTRQARTVDLNPLALASLQRQAEHTRVAGGAVFLDPATGERWSSPNDLLRPWERILLALGIRYRRPYNTRHTYATTMIMAGMTPAYVAGQLGHSVQVLFERYAKWLDGADNAREQQRLMRFVSARGDAETPDSAMELSWIRDGTA